MKYRFAWIPGFLLSTLLSSTALRGTDLDEPYTFVIDTLQDYYFEITPNTLLITADSTDSWTIEKASAAETQSQYMYTNEYHAQYGPLEPYSTYWGKIRIKNALTDNIKGILEVSPKNSFVDVYIRQPDGSFTLQRTGQYLPVSERAIQADVGNSVWIDLPAKETQELYIRIKRITGFTPRFGLSLSTPQYWIHRSISFNDIVTGFIEGALVSMAVFFLFYFVTSKDRAYLYYSLFLFSIALYYLFDYQYYYADLLLGKYIHLKLHFWLLTSVYAVFLILFARSFLTIPEHYPLLDKVFQWMIGVRLFLLVISLGILTWNHDFELVDRIYSMGYNNLEVPLWLVIIGYLARKRPNRADRIMLLGVGMFILCIGFVLLAFQISGIPNDWIPYSYNIGFTVQVICLSVALGIRQRSSQQQESARLERKVAERTWQIQEQTVKLQKLNSFRSRLLANVSHEFRTPLTLIINPLASLIKAESGNTSNKSLFSQMKLHAETLLQFVDELLMLSRIETDTFVLDRKKVDIIEHLRPTLFLFYDLAERQGVDYRVELPTQPIIVDADLAKITMIVNNLLSNALKFTLKGGSVKVILQIESNLLKIVVQDEGIGIEPQEQSRIFNRFYQSENGQKHSVSGAGIGLSLTQEIVNLHGGTIEVESRLGEGATFIVSLPVVVHNTRSRTVVQKENYTSSQILPEDAIPVPSEVPRVLIVEDNIYMRQHLQECLQNQYRLHMAADGKEGQRIAEAQLPDLIVTDLAMPQRDGMQLTQALKNNLLTSHIPVIMLTAWADSEHQTRGWGHGADAYITKPFDEDLLRVRIKNLLEERARLKEYYHRQLFQAKNTPNSFIEKSNDIRTNPFLDKLKEAMEMHYSNSALDVKLLSSEVALSSSHLNRKLKSLINQSTNEFIRTYRLEKAAELLTTNGYNIAEVAYQVGFDNPSYFTLRFREHFGCLPSQYQKRVKNEA